MKTITATVLYSVHVKIGVEENILSNDQIRHAILDDARTKAFPTIGSGSYSKNYIVQCNEPELNDIVNFIE